MQFYITLIGVLAGVYSGARFAGPLAAWLARFDALAPVVAYLDTTAYGLVVVGVTFLSLIVGELVPKRWALTNPEAIAARLAPLMEALAIFSKPFVWVLQGSTELVARALGIRTTTNRAVSEEEIRSMIAEATHTGIFHVAEHQMIEGVLRLPDRTVRSIMVPRGDVVWLDAGDNREKVWNAVRTSGHSRYPVCRGQLDELVGVVMTGDLAEWLGNREAGELAARAHAPLIVHESTRILRLLELFRESKMHFAVIVDEHGSIEGVVTPSDILTAIAGELAGGRERGAGGGGRARRLVMARRRRHVDRRRRAPAEGRQHALRRRLHDARGLRAGAARSPADHGRELPLARAALRGRGHGRPAHRQAPGPAPGAGLRR